MGTLNQASTRSVRRGTKEFDRALDSAVHIKCYSLDGYFIGKELRDDDPALIMPPRQWLKRELERFDFAKLRHRIGTSCYTLHVHSNLWYEFEAAS